MEYVEFLEQVRLAIQQKGDGAVKVSVTRILKNNKDYVDSMTILRNGENIAPAIYLNQFYEQYKKGKTVDEIAEAILDGYRKNKTYGRINLSFYTDYERVRGRVACKLINYEKNRHMMGSVPHSRFLDLAVVYYCQISDPLISKGSILVQNAHLELWQVELEELHDAAMTNTIRMAPYELLSITDMLEDIWRIPLETKEVSPLPMYVLTNTDRWYGAVNLIYDTILEAIAERLGDDYYVLPSSIHECMILPRLDGIEAEELQRMVHEINSEHVALEDILGESVYCYRRAEKKLSIVCSGQSEMAARAEDILS